ncbi:MAG: mechanosensitive ion channel family protein [Oscillospiraceae bacterium]|nr:mechanosensitive ion channel family protein [Oscillospiraceae bacterium]
MQLWLDGILDVLIYRVLPFSLIVLVGVFITRFIVKLVSKALEKSKLEKAAHSLIKSLVRAVLYLAVGLIAASVLGIDITGVVALASVITVVVTLSVQNLLTNVIGGFILLYTNPFGSGDYVEIADEAGTVQEIGMTYTKLVTGDNKLIFIPNSAVTSANIVNYSDTGSRRVELKVSASYDAPTQTVFKALLEAAKVEGVLADPAPFVAVNAYNESDIEYVMRVWAATGDYWKVYYAMNEKVRYVFEEHGIEMSYPHLNVHLDK